MFACVVLLAQSASAQSTLVEYPTPVFSNEIAGRIAPRDIGDARLTRHFYTFNGTEGDLLLTVEGTGLDGSIDLFTSPGLRPLTGVTLYAGTQTRVTRSIYLQGAQALVLRVEARAAGDEEGSYRVRLDGAFAPASAEMANANVPELPTLPETTARRGTRRANAAGVLLPEPTPEPTPVVTAEADERRAAEETTNERASEETSADTREPAATRTPTRPAPARTRTPRRRGSAARRTQPPATSDAPADTSTTESAEAPAANRRATRRAGRRSSARNRPETARDATSDTATPAPSTSPPVVTATRLVIETKDGNRIERDMTGLRRVSVDNNQVVITGRDGRVERVPLANVQRMSIEP